MVDAGVGANVGIILYVIGEGRYQAANFPNAVVNDAQLVWARPGPPSRTTRRSPPRSWPVVAGGPWLTEFAGATPLGGTPDYVAQSEGCTPGATSVDAGGAGGGTFTTFGSGFAALYYAGCECVPDGTCATDGGDGFEGGEEGTGSCTACDGYDDLQVATAGLDPSSTWIHAPARAAAVGRPHGGRPRPRRGAVADERLERPHRCHLRRPHLQPLRRGRSGRDRHFE